jgi:hypothetical protein
MRLATRQGLTHPALMRLAVHVLGNLTDPNGRDTTDRLAHALTRLTPAS